ncbi:LapA family protein [Gilliamella intestini]|uniref:Probable lipopolysaccharide assembly protein A n=1 Tax=Gilliamella intestini TaxID=1798183 RepID=A0A1C4A310_9GAMM|nr:lipopolysaccharide assembly protein LapA domain-containing protein [Gilliamella intestini]SCB89017.1 putative membrane protein [Gilliamella intestini]
MKFVISILLIIIVFAISIAIGSANDQLVIFNYLVAKTEIRLSVLLAILFGSGFIIGWVLTGIFFLKAKFQHSSTKRKLNKLQQKYDEGVANHQQTTLTKTN